MGKSENKARRSQPGNAQFATNPSQGQYAMQNYSAQAFMEPPQNAHTKQVDSWRSYKNDFTNLQSATSAQPTLNAAAADFVPTSEAQYLQNSHYTPYKPLRVSDGSAERKVLQNSHKTLNTASANSQATNNVKPTTGFTARYPTRKNRGLWDNPLPSIEGGPDNSTYKLVEAVNNLKNDSYRQRTPRRTASPPAPAVTEMYQAEANKSPVRVSEPRKLLVILDLNGTLVYRGKPASTGAIHVRPGVMNFLQYLFDNHVVMIYTSAISQSADRMVKHFMHPNQRSQLAALWARDKLDLSQAQFNSKVQVYKKLDKIWKDENIQKTAGEGRKWDQTNTILVDDSKLKALAQPHNLLQVPEYTKADIPKENHKKKGDKEMNKIQQDIMKQLELKLEELKYQEDVSRLIRTWQAGEADVPRLPGQKVVVEETVDQSTLQATRSMSTDDELEFAHTRPQLPTPQSTIDEHENGNSDDEDGGVTMSGFVAVNQMPSGKQSVSIPGLGQLTESDDEGNPSEPKGERSISPIDESVFRELLEGTGK